MQIDKVHENTTKQTITNLKENICQLHQHVKAFKIFMPLYKYVYFETCQSWWTKHPRQRWKSNNFDFYMCETACTNLFCKLFSCKKRFHLAILQLERISRACFFLPLAMVLLAFKLGVFFNSFLNFRFSVVALDLQGCLKTMNL